jgi:membrane-associated phospholipid phosphatase
MMDGRMSWHRRVWGQGRPLLLAVALFGSPRGLRAQEQSTELMQAADSHTEQEQTAAETPRFVTQTSTVRSDDNGNAAGTQFVKNLWSDQVDIWTSPSRLHWEDGKWLLPFVELTGGLFATDRASERAISSAPANLNRYRSLSNDGLSSLIAAGAGVYLWSYVARNAQMREAGVLGAEAVLDSLAVSTAGEYSLGRARPDEDAGRGKFFAGGTSFPSNHAVIAWSAASVLVHEYPGPLTEFLAYGTASAISVSRVLGKEHFPSDVVVGSAMGWLIGREVYRKHHSSELDAGGGWQSLSGDEEGEQLHDTRNMGSPFVPLDSWVYPALEKLAALGYVSTAMEGLRPWTRVECARLTEEAEDVIIDSGSPSGIVSELKLRLEQEFSYEMTLLAGNRNLTANVDSIYARAVSISGPPLTNFHLGQTISYDFGRPYERGTNGQAGGSWSAAAGPAAIYVRAEYQHAPSAPALSDAVRNVIALRDEIPEPPGIPVAEVDRPRLLDSYIAVNVNNWEISLGKQSLTWGPGPGGSLLWSDNAEPVNMARIVNPEPFSLPGVLRFLGPVRIDQFFGRLQGHSYIPRPFIYGQKINFKPLPCLELGFGRTTIIGGNGGDPITTGNLLRSFLPPGINPSTRAVPGDGRDVMDWTFYIPGIRNYVVLYGEVYADDDIIAWQNPAKNPYRPGIYLTRIPGISNLDFHAEVVSTESPGWSNPSGNHGNLNYWNNTYRDGYTNNGNLIGNTVGRMGRAIECWFSYQLGARNSVQFIYKHNSVSPDFIPQGGYWQDYAARNDLYLASGFYLRSELQFEHISSYPILFNGSRESISAILELGFVPSWGRKSASR